MAVLFLVISISLIFFTEQRLSLLEGWPLWSLQAGVAILATVLLVLLAVSIALAEGGDPATFALNAAIFKSSSFLFPTYHVTALIMGPQDTKWPTLLRTAGS